MSCLIHQIPVAVMCLLMWASSVGVARAEPNAITEIQAVREGALQQLKLSFRRAPAADASNFSTPNPPRLVLDFADTLNATGHARQVLDTGDLRHVDIVQVSGRTRLVLALKRSLPFASRVQGKTLILSFSEAATSAAGAAASAIATERNAILDVDFRRGSNESGRVIVDLSQSQAAIDIRRQGQSLVIDFMKTSLPDLLRRRLDVKDFGTPVQSISTSAQGDMVRLLIEPSGQWEHTAWQTDKRLVVEVRPWRPDDAKTSANGRGYRGDKLSLNFQNIEVRALLQVIADFTGLNVVASDSVSGQLTLRLKDVPWDQALDIVMQAADWICAAMAMCCGSRQRMSC